MEDRDVIIARIKRILGQIQGLQRMVEQGQKAGNILNQVKAVEAALWQLGVTIVHCEATRQCQTSSETEDICRLLGLLVETDRREAVTSDKV